MNGLLLTTTTAALILIFPLLISTVQSHNTTTESDSNEVLPLVYLGVLARNSAHLLHTFFGYIERLDYPKERIIIGLYTDDSIDNTVQMLREWTLSAQQDYHSVYLTNDGGEGEERGENSFSLSLTSLFLWDRERLGHMSTLRQRVLEHSRQTDAQYLFFVDCDNFLVNPKVLKMLIEAKKPIIAPMLLAGKDKAFTNFWGGQNEQGYYVRAPDYLSMVARSMTGCFKVPLVHSTLLIDLRTVSSQYLAYWPPHSSYKWDIDDIIIFSFSARVNGLGMYVLNTEVFGYLLRPEQFTSLDEAISETLNWKLKTIVNHPPVPISGYLTPPPSPPTNKLNTDAIFMIGLERRTERRQRMTACLQVLDLNYRQFDAIDGKKLNESYLNELGIKYLPGWKDPWGERPMTYGEVGCFLSHYFIWLTMIGEELGTVLILEDDIDFEPNFKQRLLSTLEEVNTIDPHWDLVYVGRKELQHDMETIIPGTKNLVRPTYSYWTLGYLISLRGAKKLIAARPFDKLLPVDEFIPIMFDQHPESDWVQYYPTRNLRAYSASPLLVYPTHYVGDKEWFSDTEPPIEVLEKIRLRKVREEEEEAKKKQAEKQLTDSAKTEL